MPINTSRRGFILGNLAMTVMALTKAAFVSAEPASKSSFRLIPNIAALRAATTDTVADSSVQTLSYYTVDISTKPDDSGSMYLYDQTDLTSADNGGTIIVDASNRRWKLLLTNGFVTPKQFGAKGDGTTDDTAALAALLSCGVQKIDFGTRLNYKILLTQGSYLCKFTAGEVHIKGNNTTISDATIYTRNGPFTQIFWGDAVTRMTIEGVNYIGPTIQNPHVNHGYIGASFVRFTSGARNLMVQATIQNARHGIHSGDYSETSLGGCSIIRGKIDTIFVGYPIATYLCDDIEISIDSKSNHRCAYIAGCDHLRLNAKFKDQYVAPIQCLLTDAKIGIGISKGCSDCIVNATDMGSMIFTANSWCSGISMSRVDPGTEFRDIVLNIYVKASDAVATTLGAAAILSNARIAEPGYPYNWEQTVTLKNISITGMLDRSAQTVAEHGVGEIYINTLDSGTHYAKVRNIVFSALKYLPGKGPKPRGIYYSAVP